MTEPLWAGERIGVDIGGTTVRAVAVTADGVVTRRAGGQTPAREGAAAILDRVVELVRALDVETAGPVGVGSAGLIDSSAGTVVAATAGITGWPGTSISGGLTARLGGTPVYALNDVQAMAVGEMRLGVAAGTRSALVVTVGTGVGGALVVDDALVTGAHWAAGHVGHMPSPGADGAPCPCGRAGHVEAVASAPAMLESYRAAGRDAADLAEVALHAREGDDAALAVFATGGAALGSVLGGLVNVVDPEVVVLAGGVIDAGEPFLGPLRAAVRQTAVPALAEVPVRVSHLGGDAVAVGAAVHASGRADHSGVPA